MPKEITLICVIFENHELLVPHFINHYKGLKIEKFIFGVKGGKKNPAWNYLNKIKDTNITTIEFHTKQNSINGIVDSNFINSVKNKIDGWYVPADLDELHMVGNYDFQQLADMCESQNKLYVVSYLIDRLAAVRTIADTIHPNINIFDQFPVEELITKNISKALDKKICLLHKNVDIGCGHHFVLNYEGSCLKIVGRTYHFKWFGNVLDRERIKMECRKANNSNWYKENENTIKYFIKK